jgi:putative phosphoribosyl transferase
MVWQTFGGGIMSTMIFQNREHAGRLLAERLRRYAGRDDVIVLGLPRGGVPVAGEVARALRAPLDVMVVRKLGVPGREEFAMGAIATGGVTILNETTVRALGISRADIERTLARETAELRRREIAFRGHEGAPEVAGKTVILIDDGIATGSTLHAAVQALQQQRPKEIVIAAPVTASDAEDLLAPLVDEFVAVSTPQNFQAVGQWYEDFEQTTDEEVRDLLADTTPASHLSQPTTIL